MLSRLKIQCFRNEIAAQLGLVYKLCILVRALERCNPLYDTMRNEDFMKRINTEKLSAQKIGGKGEIEYCLWVSNMGELYVQLESNDGGTFSNLLFSVTKYAAFRNDQAPITEVEGYDLNNGRTIPSSNNNDSAFLKAALRHLLDIEG
jgi:hypothetical protein